MGGNGKFRQWKADALISNLFNLRHGMKVWSFVANKLVEMRTERRRLKAGQCQMLVVQGNSLLGCVVAVS